MSIKSDVELLSFPSSHHSFTRCFLDYVSRYGEKTALIDPHTNEELSFAQLRSEVSRIQQRLVGISKGSVIATVCGNSIPIILTYLAAIDLGAVVVPVNPASKQYELDKYMTECRVECVLTEDDYARKVGEFLKQSKFDSISTIVLEELRKGECTVSDAQAESDEEDTAFVFFSSGTTGPPKAIRHSHRTLLAHLRQVLSIARRNSVKYPFPLVHAEVRVHGVLPYFHAGGLITVFCMLVQGATVVINRKWSDDGFLRILQDYQITTVNIVPPVLDFLVKDPMVDSFDLKCLRNLYVGAAKCEERLLQDLKHRLPDLKQIIQLFGLTEAGVLLFVTPAGNPHLSSVGRAMPGVQAKILDQHGDQLGVNEIGNLMVQAPTLMQGYLGQYDSPPDGWFFTGDMASVDGDGFVYIVGREKDMIKVRGWQVNPYEIEEAIKANVVGVEDCAVVGANHEADGQRPKAFIVGPADINDVVEFVKETFTSYKHLCAVEVVDFIPRNPSGKILRHELTSEPLQQPSASDP